MEERKSLGEEVVGHKSLGEVEEVEEERKSLVEVAAVVAVVVAIRVSASPCQAGGFHSLHLTGGA